MYFAIIHVSCKLRVSLYIDSKIIVLISEKNLLWSHIRGSNLAVFIFFLSEQGQLLNSSIGSLWSKFFILKVDIVLKGVIPQISKKEIIKVVPLCLNGGKTRYQIPNLEWRDFFQYYHTNPIFSVLQLLKHWDIFFFK